MAVTLEPLRFKHWNFDSRSTMSTLVSVHRNSVSIHAWMNEKVIFDGIKASVNKIEIKISCLVEPNSLQTVFHPHNNATPNLVNSFMTNTQRSYTFLFSKTCSFLQDKNKLKSISTQKLKKLFCLNQIDIENCTWRSQTTFIIFLCCVQFKKY